MSLSSEIVIVSGLPRSGTSLMMQMLDRGGIEVVTDRIRVSDTDNPHGYYEYEPVKKTRDDPSWVPAARGKAVKMVSALLYNLPGTERYRILFMERDMDEVLTSQEKMLQRLGRPSAPSEQLRASFRIHLDRLMKWLPQQRNMQVLTVNYNRLLNESVSEVEVISKFLDGLPATDKMLSAIDPGLYRNRKSTGG
jgi:hypothetical protein